ncbi:MAG: crossover junction endodeoxyribonuclease RuvC [Thermaerobacter sp.]|nr:crossover junction endodeoxyribonuclease RuvC [Thermaerobacter sp.]
MIVLGIDPGIETCGYGVIKGTGNQVAALSYGVITTTADQPTGERLRLLHTALAEVIREQQPARVSVERLYFSRNVGSAIAVGQARGVALLAAAQHEVPIAEYTPPEVKQAVSGYGSASKDQVLRMVRTILGLGAARMRDDAADALAIALCGYFRADWEAKAL